MPKPRRSVHYLTGETRIDVDGLRCPHCRKRLPTKLLQESWVEDPHGEWTVAYRLVSVRGRPVVGEIRVFPSEGVFPADHRRRKPGRWSADDLGIGAKVPAGGVPGAFAPRGAGKTIPARVVGEVLRDFERAFPKQALPVFGRHGLSKAAREVKPRRGKRLDDRLLAECAAAYVRHLPPKSRRPIKDAAAELFLDRRGGRTYLRDLLVTARERGLLTKPEKPGVPGGELTPKAIRLLSKGEQDARKR